MTLPKIVWPDGKKFAFTVLDDTDRSTLQNVSHIYSFLSDCGFRTTKSVWISKGKDKPINRGASCEDHDYLSWILNLQKSGFEIASHMGTYHSSLRSETVASLDRFSELFGSSPKCMSNHVGCREALYWGNYRFTGLIRVIYNILTGFREYNKYNGHIESSPYFWGDICKKKIKYVRNWIFHDINTLKICPFMPYYDPRTHHVKYWFASSLGEDVNFFNRCISKTNQNRLEEEGGACIMYTHFAFGFLENGRINPLFKSLLERLSKKDGWFVPVSTLLDYIIDQRGEYILSNRDRKKLERLGIYNQIRFGLEKHKQRLYSNR